MKSKKETKKEVSRRDFIKTTAVGVGATALAGLTAKEAKAQEQLASSPRWDHEADVVVVGYGGAGVTAAIAAYDAGASVLVLEKSPTPEGGNTGVCGGNSHIMTPMPDFITYMKMITWGTVTDDELITATCTLGNDTAAWLESLGAKLVYAPPTSTILSLPPTFLAGFVSQDFKDTLFRISKPDGTAGAGVDLFAFLHGCATARHIPVMCSTPAKELIQNPNTKEIVGVKATNWTGQDIYVKAAKGVVLACGGYQNNPEIRTNFMADIPYSEFVTFNGTPYNTGDGIVMAQRVGAKLWHMKKRLIDTYANAAASKEIGVGVDMTCQDGYSIFVNRYGKRFTNEIYTTGHNESTRTIDEFDMDLLPTDATDFCDYPNVPFYMIFDDTRMKRGPLWSSVGTNMGYVKVHNLYTWSSDSSAELAKGWIIKADTVKDLGSKITCKDYFGRVVGMDAAGLDATVTAYNGYCAAGKDPDFGRKASTLNPIKTPPFYAIELCECQRNTNGGPVHNKNSQTLDVDGKPIPRLYSAGELGSIYGFLYLGANLCEVLSFGRTAGAHAASLPSL